MFSALAITADTVIDALAQECSCSCACSGGAGAGSGSGSGDVIMLPE